MRTKRASFTQNLCFAWSTLQASLRSKCYKIRSFEWLSNTVCLRNIYLSGLFLCYWPTTKCVVFNTTRLNSKSFWVVLSLSCCNTRGRAEAAKTSKMSYADRWLIQKYYLLFSNSCRCSWYISIDRSDFDALFTFKSRLVFVEIGWIIYGRPEKKINSDFRKRNWN